MNVPLLRGDQELVQIERLRRLGFVRVHLLPWQDWYDLAWARKPGRLGPPRDPGPWRATLRPGAEVAVLREGR